MLKISIGTQQGKTQDTTPGGFGERITFATFQRSGRAYQQLPPSIPNPGSRKPNSTYQSLSTRFRKTILKAFPSKSIGAPGLESNRLIIRGSHKKGKKGTRGRERGWGEKGKSYERVRESERKKGREKTEPRPKRRTYDRFISPTKWVSAFLWLFIEPSTPEKPTGTSEADKGSKKKKRPRKNKKWKKKRHRVCVARGASPFLIESRLRAYILSSIGAVGSVSAG